MVTFSLKFLKWQWIFCLLCIFFLPLLSRRLLLDLTRGMSEGETAYPWQRLGSPLFLALLLCFLIVFVLCRVSDDACVSGLYFLVFSFGFL